MKLNSRTFLSLMAKNFFGYFVFFVSPTAASEYWGKLLNGEKEGTLSEKEVQFRRSAFWVGMIPGPFLLFLISVIAVAKYLEYL
ncbi:hypothetical protein GW915_04355 [bacterium]|nr:hypothetical protein [bacterium]